MSTHTDFHGVYPILYSFFDAAGHLDREAMRRQVEGCIGAGAHGIAVMGLATEVGKLDVNERRQVIDWVGEDIAGRVPYAVTVGEGSVPGQIAFVKAARAAGADWAILQPPAIVGVPEMEYVRFLGSVADQSELPLAVQNAPGLMATSLSNGGLKTLNSQHPNVCLLKAEGPATYISQLIEDTDGAFDIFGGIAGIQFPDSLRAGCVGMIPAPDLFDPQVRIYELMRSGEPEKIAEAERIHRELLPLIVFMMSSVENFIAYGKHLMAQRLGL
ncbi:MAG: dihydrodipicolinate synthase family protein, partial [Rhodospirillaceae bacterium]|nr:dihydrodipicolinate synthase family protein [Rhodospirillaceae bacterium]